MLDNKEENDHKLREKLKRSFELGIKVKIYYRPRKAEITKVSLGVNGEFIFDPRIPDSDSVTDSSNVERIEFLADAADSKETSTEQIMLDVIARRSGTITPVVAVIGYTEPFEELDQIRRDLIAEYNGEILEESQLLGKGKYLIKFPCIEDFQKFFYSDTHNKAS